MPYQSTIQQLKQALTKKLNTPVHYVQATCMNKQYKWFIQNHSTIIPLLIYPQNIGYLKIQAVLDENQLDDIYHIVQWTLISLEEIFRKYNIFLTDKTHFPLLIECLNSKESLKTIYDLYEASSAQSFIHCHATTYDPSIFSSELNNIFIFISNLSLLSKKNQLTLAHFLRTQNQHFIVASIEKASSKSQILPSLLECFTSPPTQDFSYHK